MRSLRVALRVVLLAVAPLSAAPGCGALQGLAPCQDDRACRALERCKEGACVPRTWPAAASDAGLEGDAGLGLEPLPLALHAARPGAVRRGSKLVLEGAFSGDAQVFFTGAETPVLVPAGSRTTRLSVTVPDDATTGPVHVEQGGASSAPVHVVVVGPALKLGAFLSHPEQGLAARELPALLAPRSSHVAVAHGRYLHVLGGRRETGATLTVERARVYADDTLGPFEAAPTGLLLAREDAAAVRIQDRLYIVGGASEGAPRKDIEVASFDEDGALGAFEAAPVELNVPRAGAAAVVLGRSLYVLGGRSKDGELASIERATLRADGSLEPFELLPGSLTAPRSGHEVVAVGGSLFVLGGGAGDPTGVERAAVDEQGELGGFSRADALPEPRSYARALALGDEVCLVGGLTGPPDATTPASALLCAAATGSALGAFAVDARHLAQPRARHALTVVGRRAYVSGGDSPGETARLEQAPLLRAAGLGAFARLSELATPRRAAGCAVIGDYLYVMGGFDGTSDLGTIERARVSESGALGPFELHRALGSSRRALRLAVLRGHVYAVGGTQESIHLTSVLSTRVLEDGSLAGNLTTHSTLATARAGSALAVVGERLYALGGRTTEGDTSAGEQALINPSGLEASWSSAPALTEPRSFHALVALGERLYALGGRNGGAFSTTLEAASFLPDPRVARLDAFAAAGTLTAARATHGGLAAGGALWLVGGGTEEAPSTSIDRAGLDDDGRPAADWTTAHASVPAESASNACVVVLGDFVYLVGGADALAGAPTSAVYRAALQ